MNRRALGCLLEAAETLVLTLIIFLVIQNFVAQPYKVEQVSMEHTLLPGQYVLIDKLSPHWDSYKRGDIVVFPPPPGADAPENIPYIKRVIGLPGDVIDVRDGHVFINDQEITEPYVYVDPQTHTPNVTDPLNNQTHWVVPPGQLFVLGDHREASSDSRQWGTIPISTVIGRAWLRYWPLDTFSILPTPSYPDLSPLLPLGSPTPSAAPASSPPTGLGSGVRAHRAAAN